MMRIFVYVYIFLTLVGHMLPIPSATDQDGEDDELIYSIEKGKEIPFELVLFGSNQIGKVSTAFLSLIIVSYFSL